MPDTNPASTAITAPPASQQTLAEVPPAGVTARTDFGGSEVTQLAETATSMTTAAARAEVEARFIVAMQRPRDMTTVHARVINECKRPGFAEVVEYVLPPRSGSKKEIRGPSIRFAEAAARCMGNLDIRTYVVSDNRSRQIVKAIVTDLETNASYSDDIVVEKTMERKFVKEGQPVLGSRRNSYGEPVYLVEADEGALRMKRQAEISKAVRTLILRLVPGDIVDDAVAQANKTVLNKASEDPGAARKAIAASFLEVGVQPEALAEYLGHPLESTQPAELVDLRGLFRSIKEGQSTWRDVLEAKASALAQEAAEKAAAEGTGKKSAADSLKDRVKGQTAS